MHLRDLGASASLELAMFVNPLAFSEIRDLDFDSWELSILQVPVER